MEMERAQAQKIKPGGRKEFKQKAEPQDKTFEGGGGAKYNMEKLQKTVVSPEDYKAALGNIDSILDRPAYGNLAEEYKGQLKQRVKEALAKKFKAEFNRAMKSLEGKTQKLTPEQQKNMAQVMVYEFLTKEAIGKDEKAPLENFVQRQNTLLQQELAREAAKSRAEQMSAEEVSELRKEMSGIENPAQDDSKQPKAAKIEVASARKKRSLWDRLRGK